jgi:pimeloyl-ACP methyl ester carboxylesterase
MGIDLETLERHRRFEDPTAGFSEEFIQPKLGLGRTVGVISRPLGDALPVGWVLCHAFGMEQIHVSRLEVITARVLAGAGFPVLRFSGQGYGDSELGMEAVGLTSHLTETEDAVELMRSQEGVERVGVLGARFGGAVAGIVAQRLGLPYAVLWDPVVRGRQYLREIFRSEVLSEIMENGDGGGAVHVQQLRDDLDTQGWTDIKGWPLSRHAHDEISSIDLSDTLSRFQGSALIVALSRTPKVPGSLTALSEAISNGGGSARVELVQDPVASQFGQFRWRAVEGGRSKRDSQLELNEKMAAVSTAWALEQAGAAARIGESRVTP